MPRHADAVMIQRGACNPIAISRTLVKAIDEIREKGTDAIWADEAVRMILHQMCFMAKVEQLDSGLGEYERCMKVCEESADKPVN